MRALTSAAAAAILNRSVPVALLVEMQLTVPLYLNTTSLNLTINGSIYYGTKGLGAIDSIQESPAEVRGLKFSLSGVPSSNIALALTEPVQGELVTIKVAIFDPVTYQILDVRTRWSGRLDVFAIDDGGKTATLSVTAEHAGIDLTRPSQSLMTDIEQQRLNSGDLSLQYMNDQVERVIVWPAASWGKV